MAKKKRQPADRVPTPAEVEAKAADQAPPEKHPSARGGRETMDALVVAFVLAFLIRTFQAEAFVIPTGSMAPTLMGRHKDVYCDQCGQRFKVNASDETGEHLEAAVRMGQLRVADARRRIGGLECVGGVCPQCRYVQPIRSDGLERALPKGVAPVSTKPSYSGDRLVVNKYRYSFADPERWDVAVFKYPGKAQTNYIKRIVGLPNEALRLFGGDLYVRQPDASEYTIARKPPETVLAMRQFVHDTDRDPALLRDAGWPLRWRTQGDGWRVDLRSNGKDAPQTYTAEGDGERWLWYRHTLPGEAVWQRVLAGEGNLEVDPPPALITDFIPYNARVLRERVNRLGAYTLRPERDTDLGRLGLHWVGDLMLEADVQIDGATGEVLLELVEAGERFGCAIDVATGEATLYRETPGDERATLSTASTPIRGAGAHRVRLANFDDRLTLWVDGAVVDADGDYDAGATLAEWAERLPTTGDDDPGDLAPARVGARDARVAFERLRLWRDTYYLADKWDRSEREFVTDYDMTALLEQFGPNWRAVLVTLPTRPESWVTLAERRYADFGLGDDQYFVMGDNSPESLDARLWYGGNQRDPGKPGGSYLERDLLVGKAICVYWPHSWYNLPIPIGRGGGRIPVWPNFGDMRLVR